MPHGLLAENAITGSESAGRQLALPDPHQVGRQRERGEDQQGKRPGPKAIPEMPPGWRDWFRFIDCHCYLKPKSNHAEKSFNYFRSKHPFCQPRPHSASFHCETPAENPN
jgi:hypothetical protein